MTLLAKAMGNFDLHETKQIMYHLKGKDESFQKIAVFNETTLYKCMFSTLGGGGGTMIS